MLLGLYMCSNIRGYRQFVYRSVMFGTSVRLVDQTKVDGKGFGAYSLDLSKLC
jgi:hypothetical protein